MASGLIAHTSRPRRCRLLKASRRRDHDAELNLLYMSSAIAIVNPTSRDGATMRIWTKVRTLLNENGFDDIIELQTTRPGHAAELANEYHDYDGLILAVGGDGTAHEVASGLRGGKTVLGIVPTGSGNDLARTHEIPPLDPKGIVDVIVNGVDRPVPAMRIEALPAPPIGNYPIPKPHSWDGEPENEGRIVRWAFQESDVGLTAAVSRSKFVRAKWLRGTLKYTYLGIREIIAWKRRKIRLICDEDSQEIDFVLGAMMIGETFGGGYRAFPGANPRLKGMGMIYGTGLGKLKMMTLM